MTTPDIRIGDLVKATHRTHTEDYAVFRVVSVSRGGTFVDGASRIADRASHDIEVLDRPLPAIDEELLLGASSAYAEAMGYLDGGPRDLRLWGKGVSAAIDYYRKNATKENSK